MSVQGGVIQSLSASQAEEFDPDQVGGCSRRWYYHRVERLPVPESDRARDDGDAGHAHFAHYYRTGERPRRAKMAKAVNGALDAGHLPVRMPGQLIESRFDGQPTAARLPLRRETTLWLGGVPWDGYVDLRFYRAGMITVLDHKFSSDIHAYAKTDLLSTVQMPVYALDSLRIWPDAQHVELVHNYVSRRGVDSLYVRQLMTVAQVRQRAREIEELVKRMQEAARAPTADDVPANRKSCHTWTGCPFQSRCSAFKEKPKMNLSPEEESWLNVVSGGPPAARAEDEAKRIDTAKPQTVPAPEEPPDLQGQRAEEAARHAAELETASAAGALDTDDDPFAVFDAPKASVPQEQPTPPAVETAKPADESKCPDCPHTAHLGAACTGKRGRGACRCGAQSGAEAGVTVSRAVGDPPGIVTAHLSGPVVPVTLVGGHLSVCVQNDAGKWLCMEGCTAKTPLEAVETDARLYRQEGQEGKAIIAEVGALIAQVKQHEERLTTEREMHRRTLGELDASERERTALKVELETLRASPTTPSGWTGTVQVNVNLGPETLALLQRLFGMKT